MKFKPVITLMSVGGSGASGSLISVQKEDLIEGPGPSFDFARTETSYCEIKIDNNALGF